MMRVEIAPIVGYPVSFRPCEEAPFSLEADDGFNVVWLLWSDPDGYTFEEVVLMSDKE